MRSMTGPITYGLSHRVDWKDLKKYAYHFFWGKDVMAVSTALSTSDLGSIHGDWESGHTVSMKRVLTSFDLTLFGTSAVLGAGIFVLTGLAANLAGPAVCISFVISGGVALVTALCYAEYACRIELAGGAYNYTTSTFGSFVGWMVGMNMVLEYVLSTAAVAKGFTAYLQALIESICSCQVQLTSKAGGVTFDWPAFGLVLFETSVLAWGTSQSFWLNAMTTLATICIIITTIFVGMSRVDMENYHPFAPYGVIGIFEASAYVFFTYIGFDMVANSAEETISPRRDVPFATVACVLICTVLYVSMSAVLVGMTGMEALSSMTESQALAPFAYAFQMNGLPWAAVMISFGTLLSVADTILSSLYGLSRLMLTMGRSRLMPHFLSDVNEHTQTPIRATIVSLLMGGLLALMAPFDSLSRLVSMGTLFAYCVVCAGVLVRRYYYPGCRTALWKVVACTIAVMAASLLVALTYHMDATYTSLWISLGVWVLATGSFYLLPIVFIPPGFRVPLYPWMPSLGVMSTFFLFSMLGTGSEIRSFAPPPPTAVGAEPPPLAGPPPPAEVANSGSTVDVDSWVVWGVYNVAGVLIFATLGMYTYWQARWALANLSKDNEGKRGGDAALAGDTNGAVSVPAAAADASSLSGIDWGALHKVQTVEELQEMKRAAAAAMAALAAAGAGPTHEVLVDAGPNGAGGGANGSWKPSGRHSRHGGEGVGDRDLDLGRNRGQERQHGPDQDQDRGQGQSSGRHSDWGVYREGDLSPDQDQGQGQGRPYGPRHGTGAGAASRQRNVRWSDKEAASSPSGSSPGRPHSGPGEGGDAGQQKWRPNRRVAGLWDPLPQGPDVEHLPSDAVLMSRLVHQKMGRHLSEGEERGGSDSERR